MLPTCIDPPLPRQQPVTAPKSSNSSSSAREPLGQRMAMSPEGGRDEIPLLQRRTNAHGRRLLALALVDRPGHRPLEEQELHPLLELANHDHPPVEFHQEFARVFRRYGLRCRHCGGRPPGLPIPREERTAIAARLRRESRPRLTGSRQFRTAGSDPRRTGDRPTRRRRLSESRRTARASSSTASNVAIGWPIATSEPAWTAMARSVPATADSTTRIALSVSTSSSGSPRRIDLADLGQPPNQRDRLVHRRQVRHPHHDVHHDPQNTDPATEDRSPRQRRRI